MANPAGAAPAAQEKKKFPVPLGLIVGVIALIAVLMMPAPEGMTVAGHRMLAILLFAVIVWLTEAVSYEVSSMTIMALIAILIGFSPEVAKDASGLIVDNASGKLLGTGGAMRMALAGFSNNAWALVAGATFLAAAMTLTGLDRRIALLILNAIGTSTKRIMVGILVVTVVLSLFVPSATARVACIVPIMSGIIAAYGVEKRSRIAVGIMIMVAQGTSIWNVGIQTAAAQNLLTLGFMENSALGQGVSWFDWLAAGGPWSVLMSVVLFFVVLKMMPPEADNIPGGKEMVQRELAALGPMPANQLRLLLVTVVMLFFWATGKLLHAIDTTTVTAIGMVILMLPVTGVISWKEVQARTPWGTIFVFGIGISLGGALLATGAGKWVGDWVVVATGLDAMTPFAIFAVMAAFLIIIHLGFASATALCSLFLPIIIVVFVGMDSLQATPQVQLGLTMLLGFVVSFGFILPINAPQNMVCLGTETFNAREFAKVGIVLTIIGYALMLVFALTYWPLLGWL